MKTFPIALYEPPFSNITSAIASATLAAPLSGLLPGRALKATVAGTRLPGPYSTIGTLVATPGYYLADLMATLAGTSLPGPR